MKIELYIIILYLFIACRFQSSSSNSQLLKQIDCYHEDSLAYRYKEEGKSKSKAGDKFGAIEWYTKAIEIDPNYSIPYFNRGIVKDDIGDFQGAMLDYTKAIKIDSDKASYYYTRGVLNQKLNNYQAAILDYNKAIELKSDYVEAYINRGITKHDNGDTEGELADYRLAMKNCAPFKDVYNNFGCALCDLHRFKEAAEVYTEGITYFPEEGKFYYSRGLCFKRLGDKCRACLDWRKSSRLGCFDANLLLPLCDDCEETAE